MRADIPALALSNPQLVRAALLECVPEYLSRLGPEAEISTRELGDALWGRKPSSADEKRALATMTRMLVSLSDSSLAHCARKATQPIERFGHKAFPRLWHRPTAVAQSSASASPPPIGLDPARVIRAMRELSIACGGGAAVDAIGYAIDADDPAVDPIYAAVAVLINIHMATLIRNAGYGDAYDHEVRNAQPSA